MSVRAVCVPHTIRGAGYTEVRVEVTAGQKPLAGATVDIVASNGGVMANGRERISGTTGRAGRYKTTWHTGESMDYTVDRGYTIRVRVSKSGFEEAKTSAMITVLKNPFDVKAKPSDAKQEIHAYANAYPDKITAGGSTSIGVVASVNDNYIVGALVEISVDGGRFRKPAPKGAVSPGYYTRISGYTDNTGRFHAEWTMDPASVNSGKSLYIFSVLVSKPGYVSCHDDAELEIHPRRRRGR